MAKVKLFDLMRNADARARGRFHIADTPYGPVAKKWPRKRGKAKSGYNFYRQTEFGLAAQYASSPLDLDLFTATEMAKGTEQVPRDVLTMAMYGYYYVLQYKDGRESVPAREMTNNVQYVLDLLDPEVGAVIVRQQIGWIAVPPGRLGDVLTIVSGLPEWAPPQGGGGGGGGAIYAYSSPPDQNAYSGNRAVRFTLIEDTKVAAFLLRGAWTTGNKIGVKLFKDNANYLGEPIAATPLVTCPSTGTYDLKLQLDSPATVPANQRVWIIAWLEGQNGLQPCGAFITSGAWIALGQAENLTGGYSVNGEPVEGTGLSTGGSPLAVVIIGA